MTDPLSSPYTMREIVWYNSGQLKRYYTWGGTPCRCIRWPYIKSHKIRSVASRPRCIMIISDKLFIRQLQSNSLYSILHVSDTKPTRNGRWAPWNSVVWLFEIPKCEREKCCYYVLGYNDILWTFWEWQTAFSTALREIQLFIRSTSISLSWDSMILRRNKYPWYTTLDSEWKVSSPIVDMSWSWTTFRGEPLWSIAGLRVKPGITSIVQTVVATITAIPVLRESPGNDRINHQNVISMIYGVYLTMKISEWRQSSHFRLGFTGVILQVAGPREGVLLSICGVQL
jgi:hypothetical protein